MSKFNGTARQIHVHPLVLSTAQEMAAVMFETFMKERRGNEVYARLQKRYPSHDATYICEKFVNRMAPLLLGEARATLAQLLHGSTEKDLQDRVGEALLMDATLRRGRARV